jgi:hypothetical protein
VHLPVFKPPRPSLHTPSPPPHLGQPLSLPHQPPYTPTPPRVTGITVSKEQLAEATLRVKAAGLSHAVTLLFCDYREVPGLGSYDKVGTEDWKKIEICW